MICNKNKCTGCFACYNICPKKAITMEEDDLGHIYPKINKEKCINCGLCKKVCPSLNKVKYNLPKKCYASYSKNKNISKTSASGGVAYELYNYILNNNGVVYGVSSYLINDEIIFERITNKSNLHKLQGSKYVHAYIKDIYKKVKKDLEEEKNVLFIGTPCQIAGLKFYLNKEYDNLILVDLICHGVPSQKMLKETIKKKFDYVNFRGKKGFRLNVKKGEETLINKPNYKVPYYIAFLNSSIYRDSCYECKYARNERISDLTIGDFWKLKDIKLKVKKTSVVLINTKKGENLINNIKNLELFIEPLEMAYQGNGQLNYPSKKTKKFYYIKDNYKKYGIDSVIIKSLNINERLNLLFQSLKIKPIIKRILKLFFK